MIGRYVRSTKKASVDHTIESGPARGSLVAICPLGPEGGMSDTGHPRTRWPLLWCIVDCL